MKAILYIGMFCYLRYEISEYALGLMASYTLNITALKILPQCISVFTKTLNLLCK